MDLTSYLKSWEYEPGKLHIRQFAGDDGVEKVQLRVDLGILQMNRDGRPDGEEPYGFESVFDYLKDLYDQQEADDEDFIIPDDKMMELQQEALQYYHRYICFYELNEHELVVRDAGRNIDLYDFIEEFAHPDTDLTNLWSLKPQLLMMYSHSEAMLFIENGQKDEALQSLSDCLEQLDATFEESDGAFPYPEGEKNLIERIIREINEAKPVSKEQSLKRQMALAVENEEYEKAANIRDQLRNLHTSQESSSSDSQDI